MQICVEMHANWRVQFLAALPVMSRSAPLPVAVKILVRLVSPFYVPLPLFRHSTWKKQLTEAQEGEELAYLPFLINWDGELPVDVP